MKGGSLRGSARSSLRELPARAGTTRWIDAGGLRVHAVTWRPPARRSSPKPHALLLHGLGGSTVHWELAAPGLAAALGTSVTAVDLADFGRTRAAGARAGVPENARLVAEILAAEGPATLVGHSMGASIAVRVAAHRPADVVRLVLVCPALPQLPLPAFAQPLLARNLPATLAGLGPVFVWLYRALLTPEQTVDDRLRAATLHPERVDPVLRERLVALATLRRGFPEGPAAYAEAARTLLWYLAGGLGMQQDARGVACPALVVHGEHDRLVPVALARGMVAARPDWALTVLEGCGHIPQVERPDALAGAVGRWSASLHGAASRG